MTPSERFLKTLGRSKPDRPTLWFGRPRWSTFEAWKKQGLLQNQVDNWVNFIGADSETGRGENIGHLDLGPLPRFETHTIQEIGNKKIWIDELGIKRIDHKDPATPGFVTRKYLEFPVKNLEDFREMKKRYGSQTPQRLIPDRGINDPNYWKNRIDMLSKRESIGLMGFHGLFWTLRDWCGFEGLCAMFADQPKLVHEMMEFWTDFIIELLNKPLSKIKLDCLVISEDMAYKTASMISPAMIREFMIPRYKRLVEFLKNKGAKFVFVDSDGYISEIIDEFIKVGVQGFAPIEIAAGNDPETYLKKYGNNICMWGGIDKRELRFSKDQTRAETAKRYRAAVKYGGYIPTVDHGVPPDIPVRNFLYMVELIQGFARGEDVDTYEPPCLLERQLGPIEQMWDPSMAIPADEDEELEKSGQVRT